MLHKTLGVDYAQVKMTGEGRKFAGYASVFGGVDSYGDTIMPGAYVKTIGERQRPVALRWNHYGPVIGKWTSMKEDETGLYVEGELTAGHSVADDAYALLKHGAVSGLSIGYHVVRGEKNETGGENLHEIKLVEISVVEDPADLAAQISDVKASIETAESRKEFEEILRNAGFSRTDAKTLVSRIKSIGHRHDAPDPAILAAIFQQFKL